MPGAGVVEIAFLGNDKDYQAALTRMGVATDATSKDIADKMGLAGSSGASKFTDALDKGTTKLGSVFSKLGNQMSNFGLPFSNEISKIGGELNDVETKGKGLKDAFVTIGAVGVGALAGVALESVHLADAFDKAQASLKTAVTAAGGTWSTFQSQASNAAKSTGALVTGNADEVDDALATLTTATNNPKEALKDLGLVEDMAALKHMSLADASQQLAKILGGNTRVIQQWGINFDIGSTKLQAVQKAEEALQSAQLSQKTVQAEVNDGQLQGVAASSAQEKAQLAVRNATLNLSEDQKSLTDVMSALQQRTKDAASNLGDTLAGKITIAKNAVHNLGVEFGEMLLPAIDKVLDIGSAIAGFFEQNKDVAIALGVAIGGPLVAAMTLFAGTEALKMVSALGRIGTAVINLVEKLPQLGNIFRTEAAEQDAAVGQQIGALGLLDDATITSLALQQRAAEEQAVAAQVAAAQIFAATGEIDAVLTGVATVATEKSAMISNAFRATGVSAKEAAAAIEMAEGTTVADTDAAATGIMAALGSTGVGFVLIGLGVAATEMMTHWNTVWNAMKDTVTTVANAAINAINGITGAIHILTLGLVSIPKMTHITISETTTTSGSGAGDKNSQGLFQVGGGKNWNIPMTALPSGTSQAQENTVQKLINDGDSLDQALKKVGISAAAVADANMSSAQATYKAAVEAEAGLKGAALAAQVAQANLDKLQAQGAPKAAIAQAQNALTIAQGKAQAAGQTQGSTLTPLGATPNPTGGAGTTTITAGEAAMEVVAKNLQGVLTRAMQGGTGITQQASTIAAITRGQSQYSGQVSAIVSAMNATQNPTLTGLATSVENTWSSMAAKISNIVASDTTKAQSEIQTLQSVQAGTSYSALKDAVSPAAKTGFDELTKALTDVHTKATSALVTKLENNWKAATAALTAVTQTLATTAQADATELMSQVGQMLAATTSGVTAALTSISAGGANPLTAAGVQTSLNSVNPASDTGQYGSLGTTYLSNQSQAQTGILGLQGQQTADNLNNAATAIQDAANVQTAQATQQATAIQDAAKVMQDAAALQVQAIQASVTAANDTTNAMVSAITDQTQTQVDTLGERGLYGLQLVAQQAKVALDQQKATDDANIAAAQAHLDQITAQTNQQVSLAQMKLDTDSAASDAQIQAAQVAASITQQTSDAAIARAQAAADSASITNAQNVAAAQAASDATQIVSAINLMAAQAHVDASQYSSQQVQAQAQAAEKLAQSQADSANNTAASVLTAAQNVAAASNQGFQNSYNIAQASAALANANAQAALAASQNAQALQQASDNAALAAAQSNANVQQALSQQQLSSIQNQSAVQEAKLQSIYNVDNEMASTEFAGGYVVNVYAQPGDGPQEYADAVGWALRTRSS